MVPLWKLGWHGPGRDYPSRCKPRQAVRGSSQPASVACVTRQRLVSLLTGVLLALVGGGVVAVPAGLALRLVWHDANGETNPMVILVSYVIWALSAAVINALWLRFRARP